jgi:hypothetical protein
MARSTGHDEVVQSDGDAGEARRVIALGVLRCLGCGEKALEAVSDGDATNFLCRSCWNCWHIELGWVQRVAVGTCAGCVHDRECRAARDRPS